MRSETWGKPLLLTDSRKACFVAPGEDADNSSSQYSKICLDFAKRIRTEKRYSCGFFLLWENIGVSKPHQTLLDCLSAWEKNCIFAVKFYAKFYRSSNLCTA
jgi:hypothetical protein